MQQKEVQHEKVLQLADQNGGVGGADGSGRDRVDQRLQECHLLDAAHVEAIHVIPDCSIGNKDESSKADEDERARAGEHAQWIFSSL